VRVGLVASLARPGGDDDHHHALADAEPPECSLVAARYDHVGDGHNSQRRARAKASGGKSRSEAASVWEPFKGIADRGAVDDTRADTPDGRGDSLCREIIGGAAENRRRIPEFESLSTICRLRAGISLRR
jgi:hypothetical protein